LNNSEDWSPTFKEEILALSKHGGICFSAFGLLSADVKSIVLWLCADEILFPHLHKALIAAMPSDTP